MAKNLVHDIFNPNVHFVEKCLAVFHFQYQNNNVYKQFVDLLKIDINKVSSLENIPFLPISLFKTHKVVASEESFDLKFMSSGTTNSSHSIHFIKDKLLYNQSAEQCFINMFGKIEHYNILALLPSYLQKGNSSLVYMVNHFMQISQKPYNGFYIDEFENLKNKLIEINENQHPTILFGVTYALIDFVEKYSDIKLNNIIVIETGGMKGRKKEMTPDEVKNVLNKIFDEKNMFREYGMTELLSQAYANVNSNYELPFWSQALIRDVYDFTEIKSQGKGLLNIIDLANIYSCSFIATDDLIQLERNGTFIVQGRLDNSEIRGCNMLYV